MHRGNGKPRIHARDHEHGGADPTLIHYEDVGDAGTGGGGGIQFDTDPQVGGYLRITTDGSPATLGSNAIYIDNSDPDNGMRIKNDSNSTFVVENDGDGEMSIYDNHAGLNIFSGLGIVVQGDGANGVVITTTGSGDLQITATGGTNVVIDAEGSANIVLLSLPTSDPSVSGAIWNDSGTLKISP